MLMAASKPSRVHGLRGAFCLIRGKQLSLVTARGIWNMDIFRLFFTLTHSFTHSHTHTYTRTAWLQKTHWDKLQLLHPSIASSEMNYDKITRRLLFIIINQTKLITFVNYWLIANLPYLIGFCEDIDVFVVTYLVLLQ